MSWKDSKQSWGLISRLFHWLMAAAIFFMLVLGVLMINVPLSPEKLEMFIIHKSLGITLLALALLRICWRIFNTRPDLPITATAAERTLVRYGQLWLYCLLVLIPLSGWVINSAANFPLSWFGMFEIPAITHASPELEELAKNAHLTLLILLGITLSGHIYAALRHHYVLENNVLKRMLGIKK